MKIAILQRKIKIYSLITVLLILIAGLVVFYHHYKAQILLKLIGKINQESQKISSQAAELEVRIAEAKKYKDLWKSIPRERKTVSGIKVEIINEVIAKTATNFKVETGNMSLSLPENIDIDLFEAKTIATVASTVAMDVNAINDIELINFLLALKEAIPGYVIFRSLEIKKDKEYSNEELSKISEKKFKFSTIGKVEFIWYGYKEKIGDEKEEEQKNDDTQQKEGDKKESVAGDKKESSASDKKENVTGDKKESSASDVKENATNIIGNKDNQNKIKDDKENL